MAINTKIQYKLRYETYGALINYEVKESSYGKFGLARVKTGKAGQSQITILVPERLMKNISDDDMGRTIYSVGYENENENEKYKNQFNRVAQSFQWLDEIEWK